MFSRKNRLLLYKLLSLFSVVRGYNILMITLAQYLASIYILSPDLPLRQVVLDINLFIIVTASALVIASGYIINNFYDAEKDLINKPTKSMLDRLVVSATLAIAPFFVVFVYYKNFETVIFVHALFLFLLILARELIKDLENMAGDLAQNYKTVPIIYGIKFSKITIGFLTALTLVPALLLIKYFDVGYMYIYFGISIVLLLLFIFLLWKAKTKKDYVWLHNILKLIIIFGVFSILLIDVDLVLNRIL